MSDGRDRINPLGSLHVARSEASPERIEALQRQWVRQTRLSGAKAPGKVFAAKLAAIQGTHVFAEGEDQAEAPVDERPKTVPLGMSHPSQSEIAGRTSTRAGDDVVLKG